MIAIAITSFKEAFKKKIILLTVLLTLIYLLLYSILAYFIIKEVSRFTTSKLELFAQFSPLISLLGFYFSSMIIAFLTIMASIGAVSSEIESGVIHTIITKPLKRHEYILGKFLGLAFLIVVYSVFMYLAVLIIPFLMGGPSIDLMGPMSVLKGLFLYTFEPIALLALCMYGSVYLKTLTNGIFVVAIYIFGTIGGMVEQIGTVLNSRSLVNCGIVSSLFSPFDVIYRKMIAEVFSSFGVSKQLLGPMFMANSVPSIWMMLYAIIFAAGLVFIAIKKFAKKDIP